MNDFPVIGSKELKTAHIPFGGCRVHFSTVVHFSIAAVTSYENVRSQNKLILQFDPFSVSSKLTLFVNDDKTNDHSSIPL